MDVNIPIARGKILQAALFPVHPIPANTLASQCFQMRFGIARTDLDSVISLTSGFGRCRDAARESLQALLLNSGLIGFDAVTQEARWPVECQKVLSDRVRHIDYLSAEPEVFYEPTGKEPQPRPVGEEIGTVVYRYCPMNATNYFSRSCIGGSSVPENNPEAIEDGADPQHHHHPPHQHQRQTGTEDLCFESRFESGNLGKVIKITDTYYQLHLRTDLYTQRHMQWYYFRISNTRRGTMYRLSIVNLCKEDSLYNEGLKPLLYSTKDADFRAIGWRRCGENISYYKNDSSDEEKERHTLTFNIYFPHDRDTVYLAHCYPYTYSDLQEYLAKIAIDPAKTRFTKLRLLCRTLAGNGVYYLTITAPSISEEGRRKKGVVITARVHPGETPSSWIMKGIIDFLTGDSVQAKELRERFIFKLVPMLNPDGVIVGNNRCSLSGKDLNRQYRTVMRESYPSVWHTKLMIRRLMDECGIAMYCDLHAHSRRHNIFIYGCESRRSSSSARLAEQVFPLMLHKNAADKFSFESCKFHIEKGKEGTGRVVVWLMGIQNSYTLEASLGGSTLGSRSGTHFSTQDYEQIGKAFCETLLDFSDNDPIKEKLRNKIIARLAKEGSSADVPTNIDLTDYSSDEGDTSASSSEEEKKILRNSRSCFTDDEIDDDDEMILPVPPPSPQLPKPLKPHKLKKPRIEYSRIYLERRKELKNRKPLDLPTTDPGSDFYDLSDSDNDFRSRSVSDINLKSNISDNENDERRLSGRDNIDDKNRLQLPSIVRRRSLSLGSEFPSASSAEDIARRNNIRLEHRRIPIPLRNLSPLSPLLRKKDSKSSRQNCWAEYSDYEYKPDPNTIAANNNVFSNLKIHKMSINHPSENEELLISCSRRLEQLNYTKIEFKKPKKKVRKKINKSIEVAPVAGTQENNQQVTTAKKRKSRNKQKTIKIEETTASIKVIKSLKLPKVPSGSKIEDKKKMNKILASNTARSNKTKLRHRFHISDDSSNSDISPMREKVRIHKKKTNRSRKKSSFSASCMKK